VGLGAIQRLASLLLKPTVTPHIVLDSERYRLITANAADPLIVRMPSAAGLSPPFGGALDYSRLRVEGVRSPYRVEFFALPLTRSAQPPPVVQGRLVGQRIIVKGRWLRIVPDAAVGFVDSTTTVGGVVVLSGWAANRAHDRPADAVLVVAGGKVVARSRPSIERPDVAAFFHQQGLHTAGFYAEFNLRDLHGGAVAYAVVGDQATRIGAATASPRKG
jgi:hypothetical protein